MRFSETTLAIVGPTGSGKSAVALALATLLGREIVSCDSVQVFQEFVIGCAKPSTHERALCPHHLLDVALWHENFDAERYRQLAAPIVQDLQKSGRPAIVCGGTGLYLRALRFGLVDLPKTQQELRQALYEEEARQPGSLYARLWKTDEASARAIDPHNLVHVTRALEIAALTGEPASVVRARHGFSQEENPMQVVYLVWPDALLRARIVARAHAMVQEGLLDEVAGLLASGVSPTCRPMRSLGYKEACAVLLGEEKAVGLAERIATATWAYARRQRTWFKKERQVTLLPMQSIDQAVETLRG